MATAAFVSTYALFGLGEAMLSPTLAPLVADLAPAGMAGQYNSAFALVKQLALAVHMYPDVTSQFPPGSAFAMSHGITNSLDNRSGGDQNNGWKGVRVLRSSPRSNL